MLTYETEALATTTPPNPTLEVGYIITFEDGRLDRFGRFPLPEHKVEDVSIFKKMAELEPSIRDASYIFSTIRIQPGDQNPRTIEYKRPEISQLLRKIARPGIIRSFQD